MKHLTPSETALRVAANSVAASLDPVRRKYLAFPDEPYSEWFIRAHSARARMRLIFWKWGPTRNLVFQLSDGRYPGASLHLLLRKRFVAETVRAALQEGSSAQVVILGAGFDPLSLQLHSEFPEVLWVEIDHPETQAVKERALRARGALLERIKLVPVDFSHESAETKLRAVEGFRPEQPGVFLAEGLLMYLSEAEVAALFELVRRSGAPGSRFLFTFLDQAALADPDSPTSVMAKDLARMGEPFQWTLDRKRLDGFLRGHGFKRVAVADHRTLRTRYVGSGALRDAPAQGEVIVVAQAV